MAGPALLNASPETLMELNSGVSAYGVDGQHACYLLKDDGSTLLVTVFEFGYVGPRFECFSLTIEPASGMPEHISPRPIPVGGSVSILLREEYDRLATPEEVDPGHYGGDPVTVQEAAKPGHVPGNAQSRCVVAYGLLFGRDNKHVAICADWFPLNLEVTEDRERIASFANESAALSLEHYLTEFGRH